MLKKIALATAIAAVASSAFAMEALDEETLSATTGQAGLTIVTSTNVSIDALRYTDTDGAGTSGAAFDAIAAYNTANPTATISNHQTRGTLMIEDLTISSTGNITTTLDVGSADATTGKTSLFVTSSISGLNVSLGKISLDNGTVMAYDTAANAGAGGTTAANGGSAFGAVSLSNISLSDSKMQITPGGASGDGITVKSLAPMNIGLDFSFTDTDNAADPAGSIALSGAAGDRGITISNVDTGSMNIDVVGGAGGGLRITQDQVKIASVRLGSDASGIQIAGASIGQVGLIGVKVGNAAGSNVMTIRGH